MSAPTQMEDTSTFILILLITLLSKFSFYGYLWYATNIATPDSNPGEGHISLWIDRKTMLAQMFAHLYHFRRSYQIARVVGLSRGESIRFALGLPAEPPMQFWNEESETGIKLLVRLSQDETVYSPQGK